MNLFHEPQREVYYSEKFDNFMIYTPPTFEMLGTIEGSSGRRLICEPMNERTVLEFELVHLGEL